MSRMQNTKRYRREPHKEAPFLEKKNLREKVCEYGKKTLRR